MLKKDGFFLKLHEDVCYFPRLSDPRGSTSRHGE